MARRPNLKKLSSYFESGKDFKLTDKQYEDLTGNMLPKDKSYLKSRSALAREAESKGFYIEVIEKAVIVKKSNK